MTMIKAQREKYIRIAQEYWQRTQILLHENTWKGFARNALIVIGIINLLLFIFFAIYLPATTNHGQSLTVPDVRGMSMEESLHFLAKRELRAEYIDTAFSNYNHNYPLDVVISQYPAPNAKVKLNRKIYLTINTAHQVPLPNLLGSSLLNAQQLLNSFNLSFGEITYVPHPTDQVLRVFVEGQELDAETLNEGVLVYQNQPIDIHLADGVGNNRLSTPDLIGMPLDEAELHLLALNLQLGNTRWVISDKPYGTVLNQRPKPTHRIQEYQAVDLWVATNEDFGN
ncbi:MAG: PASTA domain-containing protein [Flammeovirgaceae bacterium]